jgi:hypothetical protein
MDDRDIVGIDYFPVAPQHMPMLHGQPLLVSLTP